MENEGYVYPQLWVNKHRASFKLEKKANMEATFLSLIQYLFFFLVLNSSQKEQEKDSFHRE